MPTPDRPSSFDETQFAAADRANALAFITQQEDFSKLPYIFYTKKKIRSLIFRQFSLDNATSSLIEFGCGAGANLLTIAEIGTRKKLKIRLLGLDFDQTAIEMAEERKLKLIADNSQVNPEFYPHLEFKRWDITQPLPIDAISPDNFFTVAMADRVLAHNANYRTIIQNAVNTITPGGLAIFHDAQWVAGKYGLEDDVAEGLTIASSLKEINAKIVDFYAKRHHGADAAINIATLLAENSMINVLSRRAVLSIRDIDQAFYFAGLSTVTQNAVDSGVINQKQKKQWLDEQAKRAKKGKFLFQLPFILTYGWKG